MFSNSSHSPCRTSIVLLFQSILFPQQRATSITVQAFKFYHLQRKPDIRHRTLRRAHERFQSFPRITPFLWFDSNAEEAVDFYLTVFKNSHSPSTTIPTTRSAAKVSLSPSNSTARNSPRSTAARCQFTEAISFVVRCDSQQEVDDYWSKLTDGGSEGNAAGSKTSSACPGKSFRRDVRAGQTPEGDAGHDEDEKARHCGTRARRKIVAASPI